jgi:hypothetical protein
VTADLFGGPASCPSGEPLPWSGDAVVFFGEGPELPLGRQAGESAIAPDRPGRSAIDREVDELNVGVVLHPGHRATVRTPATKIRASPFGPSHRPRTAREVRSTTQARVGSVSMGDLPLWS